MAWKSNDKPMKLNLSSQIEAWKQQVHHEKRITTELVKDNIFHLGIFKDIEKKNKRREFYVFDQALNDKKGLGDIDNRLHCSLFISIPLKNEKAKAKPGDPQGLGFC